MPLLVLLAILLTALPAWAGSRYFPPVAGAAPSTADNTVVTPYGGTNSDTIAQVLGRTLSVKDFGAKCNGTTDDADAFNRATLYMSTNNGVLTLPRGTCYVASPVTIYTGVFLKGQGRDVTVLKGSSTTCDPIIKGQNFDTLTGTSSSAGLHDFGIEDMTIDGQTASYTRSCSDASLANGIEVYGYRYRVKGVRIRRVRGNGVRAENSGFPTGSLAAYYDDVITDKTGRHGVWWKGPTDSKVMNLVVIDASQEADATYHGFFVDTGGSPMHVWNYHGWNSSTTNRVDYELYVDTANTVFVENSAMEGGRQQLYVGSNVRCDQCHFFAPFGTAGQALVYVASGGLYRAINNEWGCSGGAGNQTYAIHFANTNGDTACGNSFPSQSIDWQLARSTASQTANGTGATIGGGSSNTAGGSFATVPGGFGNTTTQNYAIAEGRGAAAARFGTKCYSAFGSNVLTTNGQVCEQQLFAHTTSTDAVVLTSDGAAASTTNIVVLNNTSRFHLYIQLVAFNETAGTARSYTATALVKRGADASTAAIVGSPTFTSDFGDLTIGTPPTITADTTNGGMIITVTPPSSNTIDWMAYVRSVEVH